MTAAIPQNEITNLPGAQLSESDYPGLSNRYIDRETAAAAGLRRVNDREGGEILGRERGNFAGIAIPYTWPTEPKSVRSYRIRRDNPEIEGGKIKQKYMAPPGARNLLYLAPGVDPELLKNTAAPIVITEGEFKVLALQRLAQQVDAPGFLAVGLSGVWNFRGKIGKTTNANGARVDEVGEIPDLSRIGWRKREVVVVFDRDLARNEAVQRARTSLSWALLKRGARVRHFQWPDVSPEAKGIDDLLAAAGPDVVLEALTSAVEWKPQSAEEAAKNDRYVRTWRQHVEQDCESLDRFWTPPTAEGIPTPIPKLNEFLGGGLRAGEVYLLAGNQGSGKTSLALQFLIEALRHDRGALLFSMEMSHTDVFQRIAAIEARVDLNELRKLQKLDHRGDAIREMAQKLGRSTRELIDKPLLVSTRGRITPDYLVQESTRLMQRQPIDLVCVDHMQLMGPNGSVRGEYERTTQVSRAVKECAMSLKVPVLLVSQTSRNASFEKRSELEVEDMRGSGALEEDAAAVMLLFPEKHDAERAMQAGTFATGPVKTFLKLGKNRYGPTGSCIPLLHQKRWTRFDLMGGHQ